MDVHWGDPWADDADDHQVPAQQPIASPPPTLAPAPVLLNGFLDDAQWGSFGEEDAGVWAQSSGTAGVDSEGAWTTQPTEETSPEKPTLDDNGGWASLETRPATPSESEQVVSETSDSGTTVQPDDSPGRIANTSGTLHPDDDISTRSSTSPSDASRNGARTESPRTSFEDERASAKAPVASKQGEDEAKVYEEHGLNDTFGGFEQDADELAQLHPGKTSEDVVNGDQDSLHHKDLASCTTTQATTSEHVMPAELDSQIFPPPGHADEIEEAPDDPVYSTSARKAWYRLTRKQTLREFNSGGVDDNYIRITWSASQIRSEVIKIAARWANEDRLSGRGPGARASFYWDTAPPPDARMSARHARKKSSISVSNPIRPAKQTAQPLSTDVPAAFAWSSPSVANADVWSQEESGMRSTSSPITQKQNTFAMRKAQERHAASIDLTSGTIEPSARKQSASAVDVLADHTPINEPVPSKDAHAEPETDPWSSVASPDTDPATMAPPAPAPPLPQQPPAGTSMTPDDDDWGEMVESPAISTQTPQPDFSQPSTGNNTVSTPSTTPKSVHSSPAQSASKDASKIHRLKGVVSPTSALFKSNTFVPSSVEEGPIGPGILRSASKSRDATPNKRERSEAPPDESSIGEVLQSEQEKEDSTSPAESTNNGDDDDFAAFESSVPPPPQQPAPTPPSPQTLSTAPDSDFSIFESAFSSAPPPPTSNPNPPPDPTTDDPFSIFESPPRPPTSASTTSTSTTSRTRTPPRTRSRTRTRKSTLSSTTTPPSQPFTRTPPRSTTPPPIQPLTGATNAAQRRKAEEDEVLRVVVGGLPDLGYMLRR